MSKCCKTCKYWDVEKARDKAGRVRSDRVAQCLYPIPKLPASSTMFMRSIELRWMGPCDGQKCEVYDETV